jgi:hypothetical protein
MDNLKQLQRLAQHHVQKELRTVSLRVVREGLRKAGISFSQFKTVLEGVATLGVCVTVLEQYGYDFDVAVSR